MADEPSLPDLAASLSVSESTLRRWVAEGIVPLRDGEWTPAAIAQARLVARLRARGHSLEAVRRAAHEGRLAHGLRRGPLPGAARAPDGVRRGARDGARARAHPPHLDGRGLLRGVAGEPVARRRRAAAPARRRARRRLPARGVPAARAGLRAGAGAHRRRRGEALPPLRARAADPRRRGRARHRRAAVRAGGRAAAAGRPGHGAGPPALPAPGADPGRGRASRGWPSRTSAACGWRSASPTWRATRG